MQPGQLPRRETKQLTHGLEARQTVLRGVEQLYTAVSATYGPRANNVLLGLPFGAPTLTRDGVTVAKRVILPDRAEDDAATVMRQASEQTNKTAGDGTTATIVLGYNLLKAAHQRVVAGENAMTLKRTLELDGRLVVDYVNERSIPAADHLLAVATVSSGDAAIGQLVADTLREVGPEGGITIREQSYPTIEVEKVNGYYFDKGFFALNQQVEYEKPLILVSQKRLVSNTDILPILNYVATSDNKRLVIVGEVSGDAMNTLITNVMKGVFDAVIIPPPAYGDEASLFMDDIATYIGASVFHQGMNSKDINETYFGSAERVQVSQDRAIVFKGAGESEAIVERAAQIKSNIDKETNPHRKDQLETRYAKLVGKIAIVNVGGSTTTEMEELRFRVEDAIEAVKSAMQDGVVPGGATILVHAAKDLELSPLFKAALEDTFKKLMTNAAEPADYRLKQIANSKFGYGFNLREMTEEPIDLAKAGIWDATRAVVQTVENAVSAAGSLLTVDTLVTPIDHEEAAA